MAKDYFANIHRSMLACVKEVGAMPFILFEYYLTWRSAPEGIKPGLQRIADDLGLKKNTICNLRAELVKAGWIEFKNDEVFITKSFRKNESHSEKMNTIEPNRSEFLNDHSEKMNDSFRNSERPYKEENKQLERTENKQRTAEAGNVNDVFSFWQSALSKKNHSLTSDRRRIISARLKTFTVEQLKQAIVGASKDDWLMGRTPNSKKTFTDFETIFRNDSKVETLIENSVLPTEEKSAPRRPTYENGKIVLERDDPRNPFSGTLVL